MSVDTINAAIRIADSAEGDVWVTIEWDGARLAFQGAFGPKSNGNAKGSCGQIVDDLQKQAPYLKSLLRPGQIQQIAKLWKRWHLNDMRAGSPKQMELLRTLRAQPDWLASYERDCTALADAGLLVDDGYRYGSEWLIEEVPAEVIDELRVIIAAAPTSKRYPWAEQDREAF